MFLDNKQKRLILRVLSTEFIIPFVCRVQFSLNQEKLERYRVAPLPIYL
jgi:hypothetical protein